MSWEAGRTYAQRLTVMIQSGAKKVSRLRQPYVKVTSRSGIEHSDVWYYFSLSILVSARAKAHRAEAREIGEL